MTELLNELRKHPEDVQILTLRKLIQDELRGSLFNTARVLCGYKDVNERTHGEVIAALEGDTPSKLIVMPRGSLKSSLGCVAYPIWRLLNDPNRAILIDSEVYTNSKNFIREIKAHIGSERFQLLVGDWRADPWNEAEVTVSTRTIPRKEASITASGVGAVKVGQHFTDIIGDDYNSGNNSATQEARAKVVTHYRMNRAILDPGGTYVIIGTRYAVDDLIGFVLEELGYDPSTGGPKRERVQGLLETGWAV
jgi:hypothetical protein